MAKQSPENVTFEAVIRSESGRSMFDESESIRSDAIDDLTPPQGRAQQAALLLQKLGFRIHHVGTFSVSGEAPRNLWESTFGTQVQVMTNVISEAHPEIGEIEFLSHLPDTPFEIPSELKEFVERAYPQRPPTLFESPLPPNVNYHHLRVPDDVATVLRSHNVHEAGITGRGVLVAMVDTGFYNHPFYKWHDYNYNATLAPDATRVTRDEYGHGTAEAANIFASAPNIDFIGIKWGANPVLAFKTAAELEPEIMTNSWGYHIPGTVLPNYLKPLEAAVVEAVRKRGIVVCFSAGNGQNGFPAQMPDVIAVGGVYAHRDLKDGDFKLEASNYASSFDSNIYPGRHVPDVCGLVGMRPRAIYIMLPVEPGDTIDTGLSGSGFPKKDETTAKDGWAVISGTSAASPQIAGVCALLKEIQTGLSPDLVKSILKASARDVTVGQSAMGQPAGEGHDGATGSGLVDASAAYKLARSVSLRNLFALPSPR